MFFEYLFRMKMEGLKLNSVEEAVVAIASGNMIIVLDDEDRENEGDLIMAASSATPEKVAFIIRYTSGILCVPMDAKRAQRLRLDPMVYNNNAPLQTAFTVSVDYKRGLTTGISAEERCNTIMALANDNIPADDFARPGHLFPLISKDGGVLVRSGHTEAAVDLVKLANTNSEVGLLAELVNDNGDVKRLPDLLVFAKEHGLVMISMADLISYRQMREKIVEKIETFTLKTIIGETQAHVYRTMFDNQKHLALVYGDLIRSAPVLTRIHRQLPLADIFGSQLDDYSDSLLDSGLKAIRKNGSGVFLYLSSLNPITNDDNNNILSEGEISARWKEIGTGAQILSDLGVTNIRLLSGREHRYIGIKGFGIKLHGIEPM